MPRKALDNLTEAQHRRARDRADFFETMVRLMLRLQADPSAVDQIIADIRAASDRVSESLDATDQALIDRVTAIVWSDRAAANQEQPSHDR